MVTSGRARPMRALKELAGVVAAGVLAFFGGIAIIFGLLLVWASGLVGGLCLTVAIIAGLMYGITGKSHDGEIAPTYLGYAALPFVLTFIAGHYQTKIGRSRSPIATRRNTQLS
jgi:uncharacterized membrane protein YphA (DoxX/SURF4 family)